MTKRYTVVPFEEGRNSAGYAVFDTTMRWSEEAIVFIYRGQSKHNRDAAEALATKMNEREASR